MKNVHEITRPDGKTLTFGCPVEASLSVVSGKWKLVILWHLGRCSVMRFSELRRSLPDITQQMLTAQLRELEVDGVVSRKVHAQVPPKVEYALTAFGRTLDPLVEEMYRWGEMYIARMGTTRARA